MSHSMTWEAQDPETLSYFHVIILDMHAGRVLCQFDDNWKSRWVEAANVRPSTPLKEANSNDYSPGQTIEVLSRIDQHQPLGWRKATIKNIKSNVACVQFLNNGERVLVDLHEMRLLSHQPSIDLGRYKKMEMTPPKNLFKLESSQTEKDQCEAIAVLPSVRDRCSLVAITYRPAEHQIVVIGEDHHLELSRPVIDMAVAQKGQLQQMRRTTEELMRELSRITSKEPRHERVHDGKLDGRHGDCIVEEFNLDPSLIGAVIGKGGKRINKVQMLPGIVKINIDGETATVTIVGDCKANVRRAREALELVESRISIPSGSLDAANDIVKEVESRSNLQRIRIDQSGEGKEATSSIVITGKKAPVNWAVGHIRRQIGI